MKAGEVKQKSLSELLELQEALIILLIFKLQSYEDPIMPSSLRYLPPLFLFGFLSCALSSLELGDFEGGSAGKVQEERSFLFRQEGGGGDVVDACWDVVQLHVAETASLKAQK